MQQVLRSISAAALLALGATGAHAALVTQWSVGVDAVFVPGSIVDSNGATPGGVAISNGNRTLNWGDPANPDNLQSGLDITNSPTVGNVTTNSGIPTPNISVTHRNQPIFAPSLRRVDIDATLTLTPLNPPDAALAPAVQTFTISFLETDNGAAICADGSANGVGVNANGCADIFVINQNSLNFPFIYDSDGGGGDPALTYFISFFELTSGLTPLSGAACTAVGVGPGCLGFLTPEAANTTFRFASVITTERISIPEPGSLALAGLGLVLAGAVSRRRKQG